MKVIITKFEGNEVNQVEGVGTAEECIELAKKINPVNARPVEVAIPVAKLEELFEEVEKDLINGGLIPQLHEKQDAKEQLPQPASEENEPAVEPSAEQTKEVVSEEKPLEGYSCDDAEDPWTELRKWMLEHGYTGESICSVVNECKKNNVTPDRALEALKWEK